MNKEDGLNLSAACKTLLHILKKKRDEHNKHNNLTATWHASLILPPLLPPTYPAQPTTWCLYPPLVRPAPVQILTWVYIFPCCPSHLTVYIQPLKMELTQGSETSANNNLTPGKYTKQYIQYSNYGECLKSYKILCVTDYIQCSQHGPVPVIWVTN
jgi:hypothetical protein